MLNHLINRYNKIAFTHNYIFGFEYKGLIYMVKTTNEILPYVLKVDKASRGAGYALRFRPTVAQKLMLIAKGAEIVCSTKFFNETVASNNLNRGENYECIITEKVGQTWKKNNTPFNIDGDLTVDGITYQIKYQGATFTNEKILANLKG